jgi:hypothetical protein
MIQFLAIVFNFYFMLTDKQIFFLSGKVVIFCFFFNLETFNLELHKRKSLNINKNKFVQFVIKQHIFSNITLLCPSKKMMLIEL